MYSFKTMFILQLDSLADLRRSHNNVGFVTQTRPSALILASDLQWRTTFDTAQRLQLLALNFATKHGVFNRPKLLGRAESIYCSNLKFIMGDPGFGECRFQPKKNFFCGRRKKSLSRWRAMEEFGIVLVEVHVHTQGGFEHGKQFFLIKMRRSYVKKVLAISAFLPLQ